jgi:hypothetical protein
MLTGIHEDRLGDVVLRVSIQTLLFCLHLNVISIFKFKL